MSYETHAVRVEQLVVSRSVISKEIICKLQHIRKDNAYIFLRFNSSRILCRIFDTDGAMNN